MSQEPITYHAFVLLCVWYSQSLPSPSSVFSLTKRWCSHKQWHEKRETRSWLPCWQSVKAPKGPKPKQRSPSPSSQLYRHSPPPPTHYPCFWLLGLGNHWGWDHLGTKWAIPMTRYLAKHTNIFFEQPGHRPFHRYQTDPPGLEESSQVCQVIQTVPFSGRWTQGMGTVIHYHLFLTKTCMRSIVSKNPESTPQLWDQGRGGQWDHRG